MIIQFQRIDSRAQLPQYATDGASGFDLHACLPEGKVITIKPGKRELIPTGLAWQPPKMTRLVVSPVSEELDATDSIFVLPELQIRPRSGAAYKHGITITNAPGTIDNDYRGPIGIVLQNTSDEDFYVSHGDRIAQGIVALAVVCDVRETESVRETDRGAGGFGSTGGLSTSSVAVDRHGVPINVSDVVNVDLSANTEDKG